MAASKKLTPFLYYFTVSFSGDTKPRRRGNFSSSFFFLLLFIMLEMEIVSLVIIAYIMHVISFALSANSIDFGALNYFIASYSSIIGSAIAATRK